MCGNACHRLFNCTETVFYHWLRVSTHTPLSQMHTSRRLKIAPKGTIHASGSKNEQLLKNSELRNPALFNTRLLGHFDHGLQLNQDAFFSLDSGRGVRDPDASLLHIRLQLLTGGFEVALEIFVHCSFLLSLLGYFLCHLLQECRNSPDGIHLVPHLHGTNSRQRQIGKGKKQKCRPSNHDSTVSTFHCFVCSDKKPEPEVAKGRNNELQLGRCTVLCGAAGSHVRQPTRNISASPYPI